MNRNVFVPAAIAGVLSGALSALPVVSLVNCAAFAWMWLGGIFAVYLFRRGGAPKLTRAEGVTLGLLTGTVAGVVNIALTLAGVDGLTSVMTAWQASLGDAQSASLRALLESGAVTSAVGCLALMLHLGLGAFGGAIGAGLITRRRI
jgi:hypothetical protein